MHVQVAVGHTRAGRTQVIATEPGQASVLLAFSRPRKVLVSRFAEIETPTVRIHERAREIFDSAGEDTTGMPGARCLLDTTLG